MKKIYRILSALVCIALLVPTLVTTAFAAVPTGSSKAVAPSAPTELDALSSYLHASASTEDNTSHLPVNVHTYYDSEKEYTPNTIGVDGSVSILYIMNTNTERLGNKTDAELVQSFLDRGYFVIVLDYQNNPAATGTALDWSVQDIRCQVIGGAPFTGGRGYSSGTYTDGKLVGEDPICAKSYIVPAGYDIAYNIPYFSYDKHGTAGTFELIVEIWNNDFKSVKRNTIVKWVDENGLPRLDLTDAITEKASTDTKNVDYATWFKTADGRNGISQAQLEKLSAEEQKQYQYTYIGNTKVVEVTDCVKPDGTMIDLTLYFDVIYPSDYDGELPTMIAMSSNYTRTASWTGETRPYLNGPLFNGYVGVVSDYGLVPMCRNDHYGYFCGDSQLNSVSGDNGTYSLSYYNGIHSDTALLRTLRKIGVEGLDVEGYGHVSAPINPEKIGAYGNSKAGVIVRLANPTPEKLSELRYFEGHRGETRLEAIEGNYPYVDPYIENGATTDSRIAMPEIQPVLTYENGDTIHSGLNFVFANCGGASNTLTEGSAPIFGVGTQSGKAEGSYYTYYATTANLARNLDIPFFGLVAPTIAHDLGYGLDRDYGIDIYGAFNRYVNYWLNDDNPECIIVDVDKTQDICVAADVPMDNVYEISENSSIKLQFTGPISEYEIRKVKIVSLTTGEELNGKWEGTYGNQQWKFTPYDIKDATYYTVIVPNDIRAENGKTLKETVTHTFRTTNGVTEDAVYVSAPIASYDCINAGPATAASGYTLDQSTYKFFSWLKGEDGGLQVDLRALKSGVAPNPNARINIFDEIWKDESYVGKTVKFTFSAKASEAGTIALTLNQRQKYAFTNFPGFNENADLTTEWQTFTYEFTVTQAMYDCITNGDDPNGIEATGLALGVRFTDFSDDGSTYNAAQVMFRDFSITASTTNRALRDEKPIYFNFADKDYSTAHNIDLRFAITNDAINTVGVYAVNNGALGDKLGEVIVTGSGVYNFNVTDYIKSCSGAPVVAVKIEESVGNDVLHNYDYESGSSSGIYINATIAKSDITDEAPNADGSANMSGKLEYSVRSAYYIDLDGNLVSKYTGSLFNFASSSNGIKAGAFNEKDYGKRYRITFRVYDTTSRVVSVYNGNGYDGDFTIADFKNTNYSFYTTAGEWTTVTIEFTVDDDMYYGDALRKHVLLLDAENKSIAVLADDAAVNVRQFAGATTKPGNCAGAPGLNDSYTKYNNVNEVVAANKVTVYEEFCDALYIDDFVFEEVTTQVDLAWTLPMLSITPTTTEDILPTVSASVLSTEPDTAQDGLWIGGGKDGFDTQSVKSYVKLSLDSYYGGYAAFVFRAASAGSANVSVYGVADVNAGQSWTPETITAATAPANDIYGSGVNLNAVYGNKPLATFAVNTSSQDCVVELTEFADYMAEQGAKEITLILVSDAKNVTTIEVVGDEIVTKFDEFDCINRGPSTSAGGYTLTQTTYKFFSWLKGEDGGLQIDTRSVSGAVNQNQAARISVLNAIWQDTSYVGKTIRVTFAAKANEAGRIDVGLRQRQLYAFKDFAGTSASYNLTTDWQTFTYEFVVTQAMYDCITNGDDPNGIEATGLAFGVRFYDFADGNSNYGDTQLVFRDFVVSTVEKADSSDTFYMNYDMSANKPTVDTRGYGKQLASIVDGEIQIDLTKDSQAPNPNGYTRITALDNIFADASNVGKTFILSFRAKASEPGVMDFAFNKFGSFNTYTFAGMTYSTQYELTTEYQTFTYTFKAVEDMFTTHASTNLNLAFRLYNGYLDGSAYKAAQVYIDDITIVENPYVRSVDYTYDMDSNAPNFDTRGYGKQLASIVNGELQIDLTKDTQTPNSNAYTRVVALDQIFADSSNVGKTFTISFRAKASEAGMIDFAFNKFGSFNTYSYNGITHKAQYELTTEYQTFTYTFTAVEDMFTTHASTAIQLAFRLYNGFLNGSAYKAAQVYIDDIHIYEDLTVSNTTVPVLGSQAVSGQGNPEELYVYADNSAAGAPKIQKTYLSYDLSDVTMSYGATLAVNLSGATGESVRVYVISGTTLPSPLTYANAPVPTGAAAGTFVATDGVNYVDISDAIAANVGKNIIIVLAIEEPSDEIQVTNVPALSINQEYHNYTSESQRHPAVEPTCNTPGNVEFYSCDGCEKLYVKNGDTFVEVSVEDVVIPAPGHDYQAIVTAPTCKNSGYTTYTCTVCGYSYTADEVAPLAHTEGTPVIENNIVPDCTTAGGYDTVVYCTVCGDELSRVHTDVDARGHSYNTVVTAPTCTTAGYTTYTCTVCGDTYTADVVDALGHTEETIPGKDATCTETGLTDGKKCTVCGTVTVEQTIVPALGHTEGAPVTENNVAPDCTTVGGYDTVVYCSVCNEELSRVHTEVSALGHNEQIIQGRVPTCTESGLTDGAKCTVCGTVTVKQSVIPALGHTEGTPIKENNVDPTCTEKGGYDMVTYCTVCGTELSRIHTELYAPHTEGTPVKENNVDPTCTERGSYDTVIYCTVCGTELGRTHTELDALGHTAGTPVKENNVDPTCTDKGGYDMVTYCTVCKVELDRVHTELNALGHTEEVVPGKDATCTEAGLTNGKKCTVCGTVTVEQSEIHALGHDWADATTEAPKTCKVCGETEGEKLPTDTPETEPDTDTPVVENHDECKALNFFEEILMIIINFFRELAGLPKKCYCGAEL
ncbi:MAG: hypothetical protein IKC61_05615 [Clostridia bacterium]|nr:hypothetical protein [Clostridia bacterium]